MAKVELKQPVVAEIAELFNGAKGAVVSILYNAALDLKLVCFFSELS